MSSLLCLPDDILRKVIKLLETRDLCAASCTCCRLGVLARSESAWEGAVSNLIFEFGKSELSRRELAKLSCQLCRSVRERSWGLNFHQVLSKAEQENRLDAARRSLGAEFGTFLPAGTINDKEIVVLLADVRKMVLIGPQGKPVKGFFPPNSLTQFRISGSIFSPHEVLRFLVFQQQAFETQAPNGASQPSMDSMLGSLRHVYFDFRPMAYKTTWSGGSRLHPSIFDISTMPTNRVVCIEGMDMGSFGHFKKVFGRQPCVETIIINDFLGQDHEVFALVCDLENLTSLVAQRTKLGPHTLMMLGTPPAAPCKNLQKLDLTGCKLLCDGVLHILGECLKRLSCLEALTLASTSAGSLIASLDEVLERLTYLDVSESNLTASGLVNILVRSKSLRTLICHGCPDTVKQGGEEAIVKAIRSYGGNLKNFSEMMPALHTLSCGWGFGVELLCSIWQASPGLVCFSACMGTRMSDHMLQHLAHLCPGLESLKLDGCIVSGEGLKHIIRGCPWLTKLQVLRCMGPFDDQMLEGLDNVCRAGMKELCLVWCDSKLSEPGLAKLIGCFRPGLQHLEIVGSKNLSDELLVGVAMMHSSTLKVLRLEKCGGAVANEQHAFSTSAIEKLVLSCPGLRRLRLRHSCPIPPDFVQKVVQSCPILDDFMVDSCDAAAGILAVEILPFGATRFVQMVQSSTSKPFLKGASAHVNIAGALGPRKNISNVLIVDLLTGLPEIVKKS